MQKTYLQSMKAFFFSNFTKSLSLPYCPTMWQHPSCPYLQLHAMNQTLRSPGIFSPIIRYQNLDRTCWILHRWPLWSRSMSSGRNHQQIPHSTRNYPKMVLSQVCIHLNALDPRSPWTYYLCLEKIAWHSCHVHSPCRHPHVLRCHNSHKLVLSCTNAWFGHHNNVYTPPCRTTITPIASMLESLGHTKNLTIYKCNSATSILQRWNSEQILLQSWYKQCIFYV